MYVPGMNVRSLTTIVLTVALVAACGDDATAPVTTTSRQPTTTAQTTTSIPTTTAPTTTTSAAPQTVEVYFSTDSDDCGAVEAYERTGPAEADPIELAFDELLAGPDPVEEAEGAGSFFSEATAGAVRSVTLEDGALSVDFTDIRYLNNASTSCGSMALLSSLTSTAFGFEQVERVRFSIWESCSLFWNWLQTECSEVTRDGTILTPVDVNALASGSGCTPGPGALPDGSWFGHVSNPSPSELEFDLACWFSGPAAIEATLEDGEESPPPNDYYIRNASTDTRTVPVANDVTVRWLPPDDIANLTAIDYDDWVDVAPDRSWQPAVWLEIEDSEVVSIEEQYQP